MRYQNITRAEFVSRPNRFIAHVKIGQQDVICHVKNTGRCRELLIPGAAVYLEGNGDPRRKTAWDLVAVEKGRRMVNMDAQAPNRVFREWVESGSFPMPIEHIRPETTYGQSRFDFYMEGAGKRHFVEVKGVTLEREGAVLFPDAPTLRGVKHLEELIRARQEGYECWACFVIQMAGVDWFAPNDETHPQFGAALRRARDAGVHVLALDCHVTADSLSIRDPVEVRL